MSFDSKDKERLNKACPALEKVGLGSIIASLLSGSAGSGKVLADPLDTLAKTLSEKLKAGTNITLSVVTDAGVRKVKIDATGGGGGLTGFSLPMPGNAYVTSLNNQTPYVKLTRAITLSTVNLTAFDPPGVTSVSLVVDVLYHATDPSLMSSIYTSSPKPTLGDGVRSANAVPDVVSLAAGGYVAFIVESVGDDAPGGGLLVTGVV